MFIRAIDGRGWYTCVNLTQCTELSIEKIDLIREDLRAAFSEEEAAYIKEKQQKIQEQVGDDKLYAMVYVTIGGYRYRLYEGYESMCREYQRRLLDVLGAKGLFIRIDTADLEEITL